MLFTSELASKSLFWIFFRSAAEMRSNQHTIFTPFCLRVGPGGNSINCEKKENSTDAFWNGARSTNWPTTSVAHRCGDGRPHLLTHAQPSTAAWSAAVPRTTDETSSFGPSVSPQRAVFAQLERRRNASRLPRIGLGRGLLGPNKKDQGKRPDDKSVTGGKVTPTRESNRVYVLQP